MSHDIKKAGKIIDELITFLLKKGLNDVTVNVNYHKSKTVIILSFNDCNEDVKELLEETLTQERNFCMEEYGWELMGENDASGELNLVGMCVDEANFEQNGCTTQVTLIRNH